MYFQMKILTSIAQKNLESKDNDDGHRNLNS